MTATVSGPLTVEATDIVGVTLWMEAELAAAFQPRALRLLEELTAEAPEPGAYRPPHSNTYGPKDAWNLPAWDAQSDLDAARWILGNLGANQRKVLALIVAAGDDGIWTGELRRGAGYDDATTMSGVFKAIGGRFRRCGRRPLWNGGEKQANKGQCLSVKDPQARALFVEALRADHPQLAAEVGLS